MGVHFAPPLIRNRKGSVRWRANDHQQPHGTHGRRDGTPSADAPCKVELFTDSVYVGKGISEWMVKWKKNGWKRKEGKKFKPVKNVELWQQLDELLERHQVKYTRVAGHSGHPENERCDELAVEACRAAG